MNSRRILFSYLSIITGGGLLGFGVAALMGIYGVALLSGLFFVLFPILTNPTNTVTSACKTLIASACAALVAIFFVVISRYANGTIEIAAGCFVSVLLVLFVIDQILKQFPREAY